MAVKIVHNYFEAGENELIHEAWVGKLHYNYY